MTESMAIDFELIRVIGSSNLFWCLYFHQNLYFILWKTSKSMAGSSSFHIVHFMCPSYFFSEIGKWGRSQPATFFFILKLTGLMPYLHLREHVPWKFVKIIAHILYWTSAYVLYSTCLRENGCNWEHIINVTFDWKCSLFSFKAACTVA